MVILFRAYLKAKRQNFDQAAKAITAKGGLIGIHFYSLFNSLKYWAWQKPGNSTRVQPDSHTKIPRIFNTQVIAETIETVSDSLATVT